MIRVKHSNLKIGDRDLIRPLLKTGNSTILDK